MIWPWQKKPASYDAILPGNDEIIHLDRTSPTWKFVDRWASEELTKLREMNDNKKFGSDDTAWIRGRIRALKDLIELNTK